MTAEERALEEYPVLFSERHGYNNTFKDRRESYIRGYHQAEKDLELTWEDIETIQEMANEYCKHHSCEPRFFVYKEVLKRFKERKEK